MLYTIRMKMLSLKKKRILAEIGCLLCGMVWGGSFVVVKSVSEAVTPNWVLGLRFIVPAAVLALYLGKRLKVSKNVFLVAAFSGVLQYLGFLTQVIGLTTTTAGNSAFISALYVVLVPFCLWAYTKKRPKWTVLAAGSISVLGVGLTLLGYDRFGLDGAMWGYALGQFLLAAWLAFRIVREFPSYSPETNQALHFLAGNRSLVGIGFLFNLGIWIDKFVIWYSPLGTKVFGWFYCAEVYDTCLFFAYLTVVPAMALFLIRVETSFYRAYSVYFNAVTCGGDLAAITEGKDRIRANVWLSISRLAKSQGGLTLCLILAAPIIAPYLGIGSVNVPTLRLALLAAFLQSLLLFLMIFFLYFDWQRQGLMLALLFVSANAVATSATVVAGREYLGIGYLFALLASLLAGAYWFSAGLERLEFETFAKQVERH